MTKFLLSLSLLFVFLSAYCQQNYLASQSSQDNLTNYAGTVIFQVHHKKFTETINATTKELTPAYKAALEVVTLAKMDSLKAARNKQSLSIKKDALDEITMHVNNYLESHEAFESKKSSLQFAQQISSKYKFGYLLYADVSVNAQFQSNFIRLSNKKHEMKHHLKDILVKIEEDKEYMQLTDYTKLSQARARLKTITKYQVVNDASAKSYDIYTLGRSVSNPQSVLNNTYKTLGRYYVVNTATKGLKAKQLISAKDIRLIKIAKEHLVFKTSLVLVNHTQTNSLYLVGSEFVSQYPTPKIALQNKY